MSFAAYLRVFLEAAPMVQALILMGLYALLPFFILISRYKFSLLIIGALILFTVKYLDSIVGSLPGGWIKT